MVSVAAGIDAAFVAVPLEGLEGSALLEFPLYLGTGSGLPVLYLDRGSELSAQQLERLREEGIASLFIRDVDRARYHRRIERDLDRLLRSSSLPIDQRGEILHGVATAIADDLLRAPPRPADVERARRMLAATSSLVVRENAGLRVVRRILEARSDLAYHSMVVSFLGLGLARLVLGRDPGLLIHAGLAGLLHDVGRIGHEDAPEDEDHVHRGHRLLQQCRLPRAVQEVALYHHERFDGGGYPRGLAGSDIPVLARVVGLVDTFAGIYVGGDRHLSVYDALRILAEVYRGCFDEQLAIALVRLFR